MCVCIIPSVYVDTNVAKLATLVTAEKSANSTSCRVCSIEFNLSAQNLNNKNTMLYDLYQLNFNGFLSIHIVLLTFCRKYFAVSDTTLRVLNLD